jgi:hypothetical protein
MKHDDTTGLFLSLTPEKVLEAVEAGGLNQWGELAHFGVGRGQAEGVHGHALAWWISV